MKPIITDMSGVMKMMIRGEEAGRTADGYCEVILSLGDGDKAAQDVLGCPKCVFLDEMSRRILAKYCKYTKYQEEDFHSGTAFLMILKRYFARELIFREGQPDSEVDAFYSETMRMLEEETNGTDSNFERMHTIASNLLLLCTNAALSRMESGPKKDCLIRWETTEIDCRKAFDYLDRCTRVAAPYDKLMKRDEAEWAKRNTLKGKIKRYAVIVIWVVLILSTFVAGAVAVSGWLLPVPQAAKQLSLFGKIEYWFRFDVMKETVPVSFEEKWRPVAQAAVSVWGVLVAVCAAGGVSSAVRRQRERKNRWEILENWYEYQYLKDALLATAVRMKELEEWEHGQSELFDIF